MRVPKRTRIAKKVFWFGGLMTRIKTPQRVYQARLGEPETSKPITFGKAEIRWGSCRLSMRLLELSLRIDRHHWDHWALVHENCDPVPCAQCNGCVCQWDDDDEV